MKQRSPLFGALICAEVVLCFGPLVVMLWLALLVSPIWIRLLVSFVRSPGTIQDPGGLGLTAVVLLLTVVLTGVCGVVGLIRTVLLILKDPSNPKRTRLTLWLFLAGVIALSLYNFWVPWPDGIVGVLVFYLLPGASSIHLLYLARRALFPRMLGGASDRVVA
jgi:hypothetical protein